MKAETEKNYLDQINIPRPFSTPRIILARGAVGWFFSVIGVLGLGALLTIIILTTTIDGSGGEVVFSLVLLGVLTLLFVQSIKRVIEPLRIASLLKKGKVGIFPIVKTEHVAGTLSKSGVKTRTVYTIRFGDELDAPKLIAKFNGTTSYEGDKTVLIYRHQNEASESEQKQLPKSFFVLDCFLHHENLTLPDILEGEEQKRAVDLYNRDIQNGDAESKKEWKPALGRTWSSLIKHLFISLGVISAIAGALFLWLKRG